MGFEVTGEPNFALPLLVRLKATALRNRIDQALSEAPLKVVTIAVFILLIWASLFVLFANVFWVIKQRDLASIVAVPYVFGFFFLALMVMLVLSNALLIWGGLFRSHESSYLLSGPVRPADVVVVKYLEALFFSSWSLLLLGLPLMAALGQMQFVPWYFYPLFVGQFLCFVAIPGAWGMLLAWAVAMWLPRNGRRMIILGAALAAGLALWWAVGRWQAISSDSAMWLKRFFAELRVVRSALLPSAWVSAGVTAAAQAQPSDALFYLFVTLANALFFSWLAIVVVAGQLSPAFSRASARTGRVIRSRAWVSGLLSELLFFYVPGRMKALIRKDLRSFLRDAGQWAQLLILFGLLAIYVVNIPSLQLDFASPNWQLLISFLNMTAASLILATFTSRFVFPMISLEGNQMWLLGLLPIGIARIIAAKFLFALTITLIAAASIIGLSCYSLGLGWAWTLAKLVTAVAVCIGLCGLAVGLGARLPVFGQRDAARIASGFGGTVNLIFSMVFVTAMAGGFGWISLRAFAHGGGRELDLPICLVLAGMVVLAVSTAGLALWLGCRDLQRRQH